MSELLSAIEMIAMQDPHDIPEPVLLADTLMLLNARDRIDAVIARRLQAADIRQATVSECGRTTRSWLVEEARLAPDEAGRRMRVARALPFYPSLGAALDTGEISHEHVRVIAGCVQDLPETCREVAEQELIEAAKSVHPTALGQLCRQIRALTGADEDAEAAAQRMFRGRWATLSTTFEGMVHLEAMLDPESGATLRAALDPLTAHAEVGDHRDTHQRRADALVELARFTLDHGDLSDHNGERPHVVVTIGWSELRDGLVSGEFPNGELNGRPITAESVRRIACDANLIPVVLGSQGEVLDLGRSTPTWSRAQRRARRIEDKGCVFPKCQTGLERCQIHHLHHWSRGGSTDKANGAHLCRFHHWLVHHTDWTITRDSSGRIEVRRT